MCFAMHARAGDAGRDRERREWVRERERGGERREEKGGERKRKREEGERERERKRKREMVRSCQLCFAYHDLLLAAFRVLSSSWDKELKLCDLETGQLCVSIRISKQQQPERRFIVLWGDLYRLAYYCHSLP